MVSHPPSSESDRSIAGSRRAFEAALRSRDAAAAAAIYTADATLVAPAADLLRGREAIERFWQTGLETGVEALEQEATEVRHQGDVAIEVGRYALRVAGEDGGSVVDRGKYLIVHRVDADGRWRRAAEMFGPDQPTAALAT